MTSRGSSAKKGAASAADEREMRGDLVPGCRREEGVDLAAAFIVLGGGDVEADEPVKVGGLHLTFGSVETV
ncbi:hypothetical protein [Streptomyces sp900129855]|uniref:Uncharacterized protein n=1 Tax=Streptomyces sp. 900129855 TaxID=3155129 RepID=A0ABV2ZLM3_9ACTN